MYTPGSTTLFAIIPSIGDLTVVDSKSTKASFAFAFNDFFLAINPNFSDFNFSKFTSSFSISLSITE